MRIDEFSIGDIIQRVEHARCHYGNDGSYMHDPLRLEWLEKGVIFLQPLSGGFLGSKVLTLNHDNVWGVGWDFYPVEAGRKFGIIKPEMEAIKND